MSKYTAEQVEKEAEYQSHKFLTHTTVVMLRAYAALLRELEMSEGFSAIRQAVNERESAKAAVTNETAISFFRDIYGSETYPSAKTIKAFRDALEDVAPMLASVRVPDNVQLVAEHMARVVEYIDKVYPGATQLDATPIMNNLRRWSRMLAASPKPEAEE